MSMAEEGAARPVVFLDVDAVAPAGHDGCRADAFCLANLRALCQSVPGTALVLTSLWRYGPDQLEEVRAALRDAEVPGEVWEAPPAPAVGPVPAEYSLEDPDEARLVADRVEDVLEWLRRHPTCRRWVVVDGMDLGMDLRLEGRVVTVSGEYGLSGPDTDRAISLLQGGGPNRAAGVAVGTEATPAPRLAHEAKGQRTRG
eukprot:EG_transcript_25459